MRDFNLLTADTRAYISISGLAENAPKAKEFQDYVRFRCEIERLSLIQAPKFFNDYLREHVDPNLRVRHDHIDKDDLVVERYSEGEGWLHVMCWPGAKSGMPASAKEVSDLMLENDMQRYDTPAAYIAMKREKSRKVREANEKKSTEAILGAVDQLSSKRIKNFIEVERAMQRGERITLHGDDLTTLERIAAASKKAEESGNFIPGYDSCINPGGHPLTHQHIKH